MSSDPFEIYQGLIYTREGERVRKAIERHEIALVQIINCIGISESTQPLLDALRPLSVDNSVLDAVWEYVKAGVPLGLIMEWVEGELAL